MGVQLLLHIFMLRHAGMCLDQEVCNEDQLAHGV